MRLNGTARGLLIIAAVAAAIVVLQLWVSLALLVLLARIAFFLAIAYFVFLTWRENREGISMWPQRAQWVFYGAAAVAVADVAVYWYGGAHGMRDRRVRRDPRALRARDVQDVARAAPVRVSPAVLARRPELTVFIGALGLAFSGILFRLSHTSPETGAFYRCLFALPPLFLVMRWEERRWPGRRLRRPSSSPGRPGPFFAADLLLWHHAIEFVGAGLATVLSNTQVVLIGALAFLFAAQRPNRWVLAAIPVIVRRDRARLRPAREAARTARTRRAAPSTAILTGIAYTGFLLILRRGQRGVVGPGGPLFDATLSCAVVCLIVGLVLGDLDLTPSASALGWLVLLALLTQFLAGSSSRSRYRGFPRS